MAEIAIEVLEEEIKRLKSELNLMHVFVSTMLFRDYPNQECIITHKEIDLLLGDTVFMFRGLNTLGEKDGNMHFKLVKQKEKKDEMH